MPTHRPSHVFHICTRAAAAQVRSPGGYRPPSLADEGFIHLSFAHQVPGVLAKFYAGQTGLLLLVIDTERLTSELKFEPPAAVHGHEPPASGNELFPHLYGALNHEAVIEFRELDSASIEPRHA
jgi:uncharacterized protein (DUF952 family)